MSESNKPIFLSYASEDTQAADRLAGALRAAGIEVWFDKSELRGGDAWDAAIRQQIKTCALFLPIISRNTQARGEGYFRLEWKLAVDRSHLMATDQAYLLPIVIDDTSDAGARVPDRFREVQWTRLPSGEAPPAFTERVSRLLGGESAASASATPHAAAGPSSAAPARSRSKMALAATIAVLALTLAYFTASRLLAGRHVAAAAGATEPATAISPPPHSIAVLPFANMSGDRDQEYFSDGLTEELLNSLSAIDGLQVAARTSAFSFKGTNTDITTIARKLNVSAILEGSVRRSSNTIRISAQLINAVTGFNLWSKTYDRNVGDVLKLQTEIATAVASALKVTLLADVAAKVELGGTANPTAFDAYLRGAKAGSSARNIQDLPAAIAAYTDAIKLDPRYALAFAARSLAFTNVAAQADTATATRDGYDNAEKDARQALELAPDLAQAHLALAYMAEETLNFPQASTEYERALALAPGNAQVLRTSGIFAVRTGRFDEGIAAIRRAVVLDPLARNVRATLGLALYYAGRYDDALAAFADVVSLDPAYDPSYADRGLSYYQSGDLERARTACEVKQEFWESRLCLAVIYQKLGRQADAEAALSKLKAALGDNAAYQYAEIYAQWGDPGKALDWLETAWMLRDAGLLILKTDPLMNPLRREPRFQELERRLQLGG